ncbi:MAG: LemA family protein [Anaerovoracaceae bacterium]|jgi:LemA protein
MSIPLIIVIVAAVIIAIWFIAGYNSFVRASNNVNEAFSTMDVYMKKRFDLIPNLVETVKGYAAHEKQTLSSVVAARNATQTSASDAERLQAEGMLTRTLRSLFAVAENYPDLKANQNFLDLQQQLRSIEEEIANSRKFYNGNVKIFNNMCQMFPSSILASIFHFGARPMFEVENVQERRNVQVSFQ